MLHWIKRQVVTVVILCIALALVLFLSLNWTTWVSNGEEQKTDDAYVHANVTPLGTKVAGLVESVEVSDYQTIKRGQLIARLRDGDFRAQVEQADAAVQAAQAALTDNERQKDLQDARVQQAQTGILSAEAQISAAEAGIRAANSMLANARSALAGTDAELERTSQERKRQESLFAATSATRQQLEQAVASQEGYQAQRMSRLAEIESAGAQLSSREADLEQARSALAKARAELEVQRRQRAVLDSQEQALRADRKVRQAALDLARTTLGYTRIIAPEDGVAGEIQVHPGQLLSPGAQVVSLVTGRVWVGANYRETQLRHIRRGDRAEIHVDEFPGLVLKGSVGEVAPASGSQFALLPPDNATGNFTKVTQRVPVKIVLDDDHGGAERLRPGLSVVVTVRTSG
jgi:membrane fusion protein (multidrug efflux system)